MKRKLCQKLDDLVSCPCLLGIAKKCFEYGTLGYNCFYKFLPKRKISLEQTWTVGVGFCKVFLTWIRRWLQRWLHCTSTNHKSNDIIKHLVSQLLGAPIKGQVKRLFRKILFLCSLSMVHWSGTISLKSLFSFPPQQHNILAELGDNFPYGATTFSH